MKNLSKDITSVLPFGAWFGKRCFLIGGGPSLENFNPSLLKDELVIGTNKAFLKFNSTINYAMDIGFFNRITNPSFNTELERKTRTAWNSYGGIKLFLQVMPKFNFGDGIFVVKKLADRQISLDIEKGIYPGKNSGFGALMLAISLGATKIGLVGYDLKVDLEREKTHWHDGYLNQTPRGLQRKLDNFRLEFEEFAPAIRQLGIEVVNLNPDSALRCFTFSTIGEMLHPQQLSCVV